MSLGFSKRFTAANFLVFFALPLTKIQKQIPFQKSPLTMVVDRGEDEICHMLDDACARDLDTVWQRFHLSFISSLTTNRKSESTATLNLITTSHLLAWEKLGTFILTRGHLILPPRRKQLVPALLSDDPSSIPTTDSPSPSLTPGSEA